MIVLREGAILWGDKGNRDSDMFDVSMKNRYDKRGIVLGDNVKQVIAESVDECQQLYGPQPGPTGVCMTKFGHQVLGSCFGRNSGTSLGFAALSLRLTADHRLSSILNSAALGGRGRPLDVTQQGRKAHVLSLVRGD